jgi:hypothetical protein
MKYVLIFQWPTWSLDDYERLIATEELIEDGLSEDDGDVDGHNMGSGEMNIFVVTDFPGRAFDQIRQILVENHLFEKARVTNRGIDEEEYIILWLRT